MTQPQFPVPGGPFPGERQNPNRMAELVTDLLGAKMTAEFVREAWAIAPDDAKQEIARVLVERVKDQIKNGYTHEVERMVRDHLFPIIGETVSACTAEIKAHAVTVLQSYTADKLKEVASMIGKQVIDSAARTMLHKIGEAIRTREF